MKFSAVFGILVIFASFLSWNVDCRYTPFRTSTSLTRHGSGGYHGEYRRGCHGGYEEMNRLGSYRSYNPNRFNRTSETSVPFDRDFGKIFGADEVVD